MFHTDLIKSYSL